MDTPTTDQLRSRIDKGLTGEKVSMPDPAAAPLGTDAEASGKSPSARERALDASSSPAMYESAHAPPSGILVYLLLVAFVVGLMTVSLLLALG